MDAELKIGDLKNEERISLKLEHDYKISMNEQLDSKHCSLSTIECAINLSLLMADKNVEITIRIED